MPDLYTNLVLNDTQFKQGLARADAALGNVEARVKSFGRSAEFVGKVFRFGGYAEVLNRIVGVYDSAIERQMRLIDGTDTFKDRWEESLGATRAFLSNLPFVGDILKTTFYAYDNGPVMEVRDRAAIQMREITRQMELQRRIATAATAQEKQTIKLQDDRLKLLNQIDQIAQKTNVDAKRAVEATKSAYAAMIRSVGGGSVIQSGAFTGSINQFMQAFELTQKTPKAFTAPGTPLPKPGPTQPPQQVKAIEDTARNTKETAQLLSVIARRIGTYA